MAEQSTDPNSSAATGGATPAQHGETPPAPAAGAQAAAVDVQSEIQKALAAQAAEHAKQLKELTGHESLKAFQEAQLKAQGKTEELLASKSQEAAELRARLEQQSVRAALLGAAGDAVDPDTVLALLAGKAKVDNDGHVTIDGKPVKDAVVHLLKEKPFLAKPSGHAGSGAPQATGGAIGAAPAANRALSPSERMTAARAAKSS